MPLHPLLDLLHLDVPVAGDEGCDVVPGVALQQRGHVPGPRGASIISDVDITQAEAGDGLTVPELYWLSLYWLYALM